MPKGTYTRKTQQLKRIREEYEKSHGEPSSGGERTRQQVDHLSLRNSLETPVEYLEGAERAIGGPPLGYAGVDGGIRDGQAIDRELHRRHGFTREPDELTDRSNDSALPAYEGGLGAIPTAASVRKRPTKKAPSVTPDKPKKEDTTPTRLVPQPMSSAEANTMRMKMYDTCVGVFQFMDDSLQMMVEGHEKVEIWSTIDDSDIFVIVDRLLTNAQKSAAVAVQVRRVIWLWEQARIGTILMPRAVQSFQLLQTKGWTLPGTRNAQGQYARQRRAAEQQQRQQNPASA